MSSRESRVESREPEDSISRAGSNLGRRLVLVAIRGAACSCGDPGRVTSAAAEALGRVRWPAAPAAGFGRLAQYDGAALGKAICAARSCWWISGRATAGHVSNMCQNSFDSTSGSTTKACMIVGLSTESGFRAPTPEEFRGDAQWARLAHRLRCGACLRSDGYQRHADVFAVRPLGPQRVGRPFARRTGRGRRGCAGREVEGESGRGGDATNKSPPLPISTRGSRHLLHLLLIADVLHVRPSAAGGWHAQHVV